METRSWRFEPGTEFSYNVRQIFLTIKHKGAVYTGCVYFQYEVFGEYMVKFFKAFRVTTIEPIGNLGLH